MNILFTCACGAKSEELFKSIRKDFKKKLKLYGCDIKKKVGKTYLDDFKKISFSNENIFIKQLLKLCDNYKIDYLFAWADREIEIISKNIKKFEKINTKVLLNSYKNSKILNDKFNTYELLKKIGVDLPKYELLKKFSDIDRLLKYFNYPSKSIIIKSRQGIGGRGVYLLVGNQKKEKEKFKWFGNFEREKKLFFLNSELRKKIFKPNTSIIMEALVSPSYDVDILKYKEYYTSSIRKRKNPAGIPYRGSIVVRENRIEKTIKKILKYLDLKYILDIDFMTHDNSKKPIVCEINPRPSGSIVDSQNQGKKIFTKFIKILLKE
jgi:carbamoylphosphate synthase large subunit